MTSRSISVAGESPGWQQSVEGQGVTGATKPQELRGKQRGPELRSVGAEALYHRQSAVGGGELAQHS